MQEVLQGEGDQMVVTFIEKFNNTLYPDLKLLNDTVVVDLKTDVMHESVGEYIGIGFTSILIFVSVITFFLSFFSSEIMTYYWSMFFTIQIIHSYSFLNLY